MTFFRTLILALRRFKRDDESKIREADALRNIVARLSHGNIRLQQGKYFTRKDVDQQYEQIRGRKFSDA